MAFQHQSVMLEEVYKYQNLKPGKICVDGTLGGSGHALATIQAISPDGLLIGIDQDIDAIVHAEQILKPYRNNIKLFHRNFHELVNILATLNLKKVDSILLDLGYSLNQITNSKRGFSFNRKEPLDMRMDSRTHLTAYEIINTYKEEKIKKIFFEFGEEKFSSQIAKAIVKKRKIAKLTTTEDLVLLIEESIPAKARYKQKIHPATRIFQALRIMVNNELEYLETFMKMVPDILNIDGRILIISFHSLEDRIVKHGLNQFISGCTCPKELPQCLCGFEQKLKLVFKKPLLPTKKEIEANPMARSAKLRVAQRI